MMSCATLSCLSMALREQTVSRVGVSGEDSLTCGYLGGGGGPKVEGSQLLGQAFSLVQSLGASQLREVWH